MKLAEFLNSKNTNLSNQVANPESKYSSLRELAGSMLATIHVNFLRGTIKVDGDPKVFQELLDSWGDRMREFPMEELPCYIFEGTLEKVNFDYAVP